MNPSSGPFLLPSYQLGSQPSTAMFHSEENGSKGMDPLVLIDAIAICMAYEEKELCKIGEVALAVIFDVASIILGSKERVSHWRDSCCFCSCRRNNCTCLKPSTILHYFPCITFTSNISPSITGR